MTDWREAKLEEIAASARYSVVGGPFGSALGRKDYVDDGVPVVRGGQLAGPGGFSHEDLVYVSEEKADRHSGNLAYPGDVLVTQRGTVGQVGLIPVDAPFERYLLSQSQMKLTVDPARANAQFVYYWLRSPEAQHAMVGSTISAGVPHINLATFKSLKLQLPSLREQASIAEVLGSIDDLIESNRRRVEVLEEMARAIYREWFVHFRYPGHENVSFVDSPLGPIPEGWAIATVADIADPISRGIAPKYADDGQSLVINQRCIRDGRVSLEKARRQGRPVPDAKKVRKGDVLVNSTGIGTLGRAALWLLEDVDVTVDTHVTIVRPTREHANPWFGLSMIGRQAEFEQLSTGSTGQTELRRHDIGRMTVLIPPEAHRSAFASFVGPQLEATRALLAQVFSLAKLRDLLLPKLVTGQLDVTRLDLDALTEATIA